MKNYGIRFHILMTMAGVCDMLADAAWAVSEWIARIRRRLP